MKSVALSLVLKDRGDLLPGRGGHEGPGDPPALSRKEATAAASDRLLLPCGRPAPRCAPAEAPSDR